MCILTQQEIDQLIIAADWHSEHGTLAEDEVVCVVEWAKKTRVSAAILQLILNGEPLYMYRYNEDTTATR